MRKALASVITHTLCSYIPLSERPAEPRSHRLLPDPGLVILQLKLLAHKLERADGR